MDILYDDVYILIVRNAIKYVNLTDTKEILKKYRLINKKWKYIIDTYFFSELYHYRIFDRNFDNYKMGNYYICNCGGCDFNLVNICSKQLVNGQIFQIRFRDA